ncbi:MAG: hypothetical protein AAGM36_10520 [Cyanobacteria bacterium J06597_1]
MTSTSETYAQVAMTDDWGLGRTFRPEKAPFPPQRIDYVWHSDDFQTVEAYVELDGGSDLRPIVATLQFVM